METMDDLCRREVIELYQFFQDWFNGKIELTDEGFSRLRDVVADGFQIIFPNGQIVDRADLLERVRAAHGTDAVVGPPLRIWVDGYRSRAIDEGLQLVTYQEWHQDEGAPRGRRVTAVLRRRSGARNGVEWLHVHEVWLPDNTAPSS
jgi:hypothetical protein